MRFLKRFSKPAEGSSGTREGSILLTRKEAGDWEYGFCQQFSYSGSKCTGEGDVDQGVAERVSFMSPFENRPASW